MSPRRNWDSPTPLSRQRVCPSAGTKGEGWHTRLRVRGWGSPNSDDWRIAYHSGGAPPLLLIYRFTTTPTLSPPPLPSNVVS